MQNIIFVILTAILWLVLTLAAVRCDAASLERMSLPGAVSSAADGRRHVLVGVEGSSMTVLHERYGICAIAWCSAFVTLYGVCTGIVVLICVCVASDYRLYLMRAAGSVTSGSALTLTALQATTFPKPRRGRPTFGA